EQNVHLSCHSCVSRDGSIHVIGPVSQLPTNHLASRRIHSLLKGMSNPRVVKPIGDQASFASVIDGFSTCSVGSGDDPGAGTCLIGPRYLVGRASAEADDPRGHSAIGLRVLITKNRTQIPTEFAHCAVDESLVSSCRIHHFVYLPVHVV